MLSFIHSGHRPNFDDLSWIEEKAVSVELQLVAGHAIMQVSKNRVQEIQRVFYKFFSRSVRIENSSVWHLSQIFSFLSKRLLFVSSIRRLLLGSWKHLWSNLLPSDIIELKLLLLFYFFVHWEVEVAPWLVKLFALQRSKFFHRTVVFASTWRQGGARGFREFYCFFLILEL